MGEWERGTMFQDTLCNEESGGRGGGPFEFVCEILGTHCRSEACHVESRSISSAHGLVQRKESKDK